MCRGHWHHTTDSKITPLLTSCGRGSTVASNHSHWGGHIKADSGLGDTFLGQELRSREVEVIGQKAWGRGELGVKGVQGRVAYHGLWSGLLSDKFSSHWASVGVFEWVLEGSTFTWLRMLEKFSEGLYINLCVIWEGICVGMSKKEIDCV